jgi:hypothetical protein
MALRVKALRTLPLFALHRDVCDDVVVSALLARGRKRAHLVSAALSNALEDIPDVLPEVALCEAPNWRQIRESSARYYFGSQDGEECEP